MLLFQYAQHKLNIEDQIVELELDNAKVHIQTFDFQPF